MSNNGWKEYIVLGDKVNIRKCDGTLEKRELFPNINRVLLLENRLLFIDNVYLEAVENILNSKSENPISKFKFDCSVFTSAILLEIGLQNIMNNNNINSSIGTIGITISTVIALYLTKAKLDKKKSIEIVNGSSAVINFCDLEKLNCLEEINKLLEEEIDESKIIREKLIPIEDDRDYNYQFLATEGLLEDYGKLEKNLLKKDKRGKLDNYLDSISCDENEKLIIHDLIEETKSMKKLKHLNINRNI